jgi:hypothetical protein
VGEGGEMGRNLKGVVLALPTVDGVEEILHEYVPVYHATTYALRQGLPLTCLDLQFVDL